MVTAALTYYRDIIRTIRKGLRRFLAIVIITILGVAMFSGLKASCEDLRRSADRFFDAQNLFDLRIFSTLGLTEDDVRALENIAEVTAVEGSYMEEADIRVGDSTLSVTLQALCGSFDQPYLLEGRMPETPGEAVVTEKFLDDAGAGIGDVVIVPEKEEDTEPDKAEEQETAEAETEDPGDGSGDLDKLDELELDDLDPDEAGSMLKTREFRIVGTVIDTLEVTNTASGNVSYRSSSTNKNTLYVLPEAFDSDVYSVIYLQVADTGELQAFGEEYTARVTDMRLFIENEIMEDREKARYEEVTEDIRDQIDKAEEDVQKELDDAREELKDGEKTLKDELEEAGEEIRDGEEKLAEGREKLTEGEQELNRKEQEAEQQLASAGQTLREKREELETAEKKLAEQEETAEAQFAEGEEKIAAGRAELEEQKEKAEKEMEDGRARIEAGQQQLDDGRSQIEAGLAQIAEGRPELEAGLEQIIAGRTELEAGLAQIAEGRTQAEAGLTELAEGRTQAEAGLAQITENKTSLEGSLSQITASLAEIDAARQLIPGGEDASEADRAKRAELDQQAAGLQAQQSELEGQIAGLQTQQAELESRIAGLQAQQSELEIQIAGMDAQQTQLEEQLSGVITQQTGLEGQQAALDAQQAELEEQLAGLEARQMELTAKKEELETQEQAASEQFAAAGQTLDEQEQLIREKKEELEEGKKKLADGREQLEAGEQTYQAQAASARGQIAQARQEIEENRQKLEESEQELADGKKKYEEGKKDGEQELADGWKEYNEGKKEAEETFAEAREKLADIEMADWYVQDRTSLNSYANIGSDADSIEAIGTVFPIVFFIVAILISLTTIARMVEEDRGLIGTYKALGYTDREIRRKYLIYTGTAGGMGAIAGTVFAFVLLPGFLFTIFARMYLIPYYTYCITPVQGIAGAALFVGGVMLSAALACRKELRSMPAALMRPKAPKPGMRVFLERIRPVWSRMSFLNKVTARNLFRYKGRMLMTIAGIAGCTALLLFGFAIRDSVQDLMPRQYDQTTHYDLMAVTDPDDFGVLEEAMDPDLIRSYTEAEITTLTLRNSERKELEAQLVVVPEGSDLADLITFKTAGKNTGVPAGSGGETASGEDGAELLRNGEVYITLNAGNVLAFGAGDSVQAQLPDLTRADLEVTKLVKNYLGNYVYMTRDTFEKAFGEYERNAVLCVFSDKTRTGAGTEGTDRAEEAFAESLSDRPEVLVCLRTQKLREEFSQAFELINMVVYIVIIMSAALAFVVLFTLATTNISERQRELATIKVLGFFDSEVHRYINKETIILSGIGIVLGIPLGFAFAQTLTSILNLPAIYLAVSVHPASYFLSAAMSFGFTLIVNLITDRTLNRIDPVEALKSVE